MTIEFDIDMVNHTKYENVQSLELKEVCGTNLIEGEYDTMQMLIINVPNSRIQDVYVVTPRILATLKIKE